MHLKKTTQSILLILFVFLIAYSPVASFFFALKNDMFTGYLPPRFMMSEAIASNQLPLWNPYISFGLPFYGDMSSSYWSPLTWLIAASVGYNPYTLTIEALIYVLTSGVGMYFLCRYFVRNNYICISIALCFMCNGYIVGHLQHINWLSGAAFLPWCLWALEKLHRERNLKSIILSSIFFYLLLSSSHPGITIGSAYFFSAYAFARLFSDITKTGKPGLLKNIKAYLLVLLFFLLLSAGLILGFADIIPHFDRNVAVDISLSLNQNTNIKSWISSLLPFSTVSGDSFFKNDPAYRNVYFGLIPFVFLIASLFNSKTKQQLFYLVTGSVFLILSLGGDIKLFASKVLPLFGYVRVNAEFRIFAILCFCLVAAIFFEKHIDNKNTQPKKLTVYVISIITVLLGLLFFGIVNLLQGQESVVHFLQQTTQIFISREFIKQLLDNISIYDAIIIQSVLQIVLLLFLLKAISNGQVKRIMFISAIDIVLATLLNIPFTGVGKTSVHAISAILKKSPEGIPSPALNPIKNNDTITIPEVKLIGDWSYYSKQPGVKKPVNYPIKLTNNYVYYDEAAKDTSLSIINMPFLFITDQIRSKKLKLIHEIEKEDIISYKTGEIEVKIDTDTACYLVMLQNYYPHWYYKSRNKILPVEKAGINFIGIPLDKGQNQVVFLFRPTRIKVALYLSCTIFFFLIFILLVPRINRIVF